MVSLWIPYGFPWGPLWIPYGFPMDFQCIPDFINKLENRGGNFMNRLQGGGGITSQPAKTYVPYAYVVVS